MIRRGFSVIVDAFWGSSGKGKVSTAFADRYDIRHVSAANYPNAGHTVRFRGQEPLVFKALPSAAALPRRTAWLAPDSVLYDGVDEEIRRSGNQVFIHERATRLKERHAAHEREILSHISSTMQGSSAALVDKIFRQNVLPKLSFANCPNAHVASAEEFRESVYDTLEHESMLHEVSQGFMLSINHGSHYPFCTFRDCMAQSAFEDMCVPVQKLGDIVLVVRSFPIRVGNTPDGYSGDFLEGQRELTWREIGEGAGMPEEEIERLTERERTTVTKRIRRVTSMSVRGLRDAARSNGATQLVLTFAEYIDWEARYAKTWSELPRSVKTRIETMEAATDCPVVAVSTGGYHDEMVWR
jgi:adenylosuccinate synthase